MQNNGKFGHFLIFLAMNAKRCELFSRPKLEIGAKLGANWVGDYCPHPPSLPRHVLSLQNPHIKQGLDWMLNLIKHQKEDVNRHLLMSHYCRKTINGWSPSCLKSPLIQLILISYLDAHPIYLTEAQQLFLALLKFAKKSFPLWCSFPW